MGKNVSKLKNLGAKDGTRIRSAEGKNKVEGIQTNEISAQVLMQQNMIKTDKKVSRSSSSKKYSSIDHSKFRAEMN